MNRSLFIFLMTAALLLQALPLFAQDDSGSKWEITVVDEQPGHDIGKYASLAVGTDDLPRIAYIDASAVSLILFARLS